jgi:hypothetical protein
MSGIMLGVTGGELVFRLHCDALVVAIHGETSGWG